MNPILFKMLRESLGLTGRQVADYLGLSKSSGARTVRHWESKRTPPEDACEKLLALKQIINDEVERVCASYIRRTYDVPDGQKLEYIEMVWFDDDKYGRECFWADRLPYAVLHRSMIMRIVERLSQMQATARLSGEDLFDIDVTNAADRYTGPAFDSEQAAKAYRKSLRSAQKRLGELMVVYQGEQCTLEEVVEGFLDYAELGLLLGLAPTPENHRCTQLTGDDKRLLFSMVSYKDRSYMVGDALIEMFGTNNPTGKLAQFQNERVAADSRWHDELEAEIKNFSALVVVYRGQRQTIAELAATRGASVRSMYAECVRTRAPVASLKDQDWDLLLGKHSG